MPSQHPDFEYDIFISYRQNDNKRDGWVTKFVKALQDELDATLKNPVSIYFDENPHDGLLETHQVSESLRQKLRCLIFMPILSQTYCDTNSYAWNQEFLPFLEMAKADEIGLNVKLRNGNVSSRILPVRIHDLETEDEQLLADTLGGPIRAIDFIYTEPGVNRPLTSNDNPDRNLNGTIYRNQINKVANALKEIGSAILNPRSESIPERIVRKVNAPPKKKATQQILTVVASIVLLLAAYFYFKDEIKPSNRELAVAVLAFDDNSPAGDQEWLGNGIAESIINSLNNVDGLLIIGKRSSFSYKGKDATIREIGDELDVLSVIEGSVSKVGDRLRINAQLIDTETEVQLWDEQYDLAWGEIHDIMDDVAEDITESLIEEFPEAALVYNEVEVNINPEAYEFYLKGIHYHWEKYIINNYTDDFYESERNFLEALDIDDTYIDAIAGLADLYDTRAALDDPLYAVKRDSLIDTGYEINPEAPYLLAIKGFSYGTAQPDSSYMYLIKAYELDPDHEQIITLIQNAYSIGGLLEETNKISRLILQKDPLNRIAKQQLSANLLALGYTTEAKAELADLLRTDPANRTGLQLDVIIKAVYEGNIVAARKILARLERDYPGENGFLKAIILALEGNREEALKYGSGVDIYCILDMKSEAIEALNNQSDIPAPFLRRNHYLLAYPVVQVLKDEAAYQDFMKQYNKELERRKEKYGGFF